MKSASTRVEQVDVTKVGLLKLDCDVENFVQGRRLVCSRSIGRPISARNSRQVGIPKRLQSFAMSPTRRYCRRVDRCRVSLHGHLSCSSCGGVAQKLASTSVGGGQESWLPYQVAAELNITLQASGL